MYRINTGNGRLYYCYDSEGKLKQYISATTFVRSVLPTPPHLIEWIRQQGSEYDKVLELSANYGTLMHYLNAQLLIDGSYDLSMVDKIIEPFAAQENFKHWKQSWSDDLKSDMVAFAKFVQDYEVDALGIEMVLGTDKYGVAGALDIVCEMTIEVDGFSDTDKFKTGARSGEFKPEKKKQRVLAIIDMKSGRKGFHSDHALQLAIHREALIESFPEFKDREIKLFNWSPKDWKTEPSYNLKDQTDSIDLALLPHLCEMAKIQEKKKDRNFKTFTGVIDLKRPDKLSDAYAYLTLTEYLNNLNKQ
jgi:hypothetical protein